MQVSVPQANLSSLFQLLAEQALMARGVPHPQMTQQPPPNPAAARFFLDLLVVLGEKTEAARSAEESRELEGIIHQLRMMDAAAGSGQVEGGTGA